jgi:hypothetical protein
MDKLYDSRLKFWKLLDDIITKWFISIFNIF